LRAPVYDLTQVDGPAIPQLSGPVSKLVPTIAGCIRLHLGGQYVAGHQLDKIGRLTHRRGYIQQVGHFLGVGHQLRRSHLLRFDA